MLIIFKIIFIQEKIIILYIKFYIFNIAKNKDFINVDYLSSLGYRLCLSALHIFDECTAAGPCPPSCTGRTEEESDKTQFR